MKLTEIETIRVGEFPNLVWLHLKTDEGLTGLGETFMGAAAVEAHIHEVAPLFIGEDAADIDRLTALLDPYLGARGTGVEKRAQSAVNIALWDLAGKATGRPLYELLGGRARKNIRVYNTCAGYQYIRDTKSQSVDNWGIGTPQGPYEDLDGFLNRADEVAQSLLDMCITGMKIWPFDIAAERNNGLRIPPDELNTALEPFRKIRQAVGDKMDIMVELHGLWSLPPAIQIAKALKEFNTFWHEDPIHMMSLGGLKEYAAHSPAPVCASESLTGKHGFRDLLETGFSGITMADLAWCGGVSEARNIAVMCDAWDLPVTFHDCTGPVVLTASTHLSLHARNAMVQEMVRAAYTSWYPEVVSALPPLDRGFLTAPDGPGLGLELIEARINAADVTRRRSGPG
jgi:L-alanine-DL-glutamate epimerase-like enolase superfamily enzyme